MLERIPYGSVRHDIVKDMIKHGYEREEALELLNADRNNYSNKAVVYVIQDVFAKISSENNRLELLNCNSLTQTVWRLIRMRMLLETGNEKFISADLRDCYYLTADEYVRCICYLNEILPESKDFVKYEDIKYAD